MEILVIRFSSMGDVICATPLFSFLKRKHPSASITFVTDHRYAPLFAHDPRLSKVVGVKSGPAEDLQGLYSAAWDLVVDLQNSRHSRAMLSRFTKAAKCGTFNKLHFERLVLLVLRCSCYPAGQNVVTRYLQAAGDVVPLGELEPLRLFIGEESRKNSAALLRLKTCGATRLVLSLFPFSAWKNKEWPGRNYAAVADYFLKKNWDVVLMGGPDDTAAANRLRDQIGGRCVSLAGLLSLEDCGGLLSFCALALGGDTGLSHLSRACRIPTGVIFGPTTRHFGFFPYGDPPFKIFEEPLFCRPCHPHGGGFCWRSGRPCLERITPERVIRGLESLVPVLQKQDRDDLMDTKRFFREPGDSKKVF